MAEPPDGESNAANPFDGFDKRLPENCVEYMLFLLEDPEASRKRQLIKLEDLRKTALKLSKEIASEYIWQREEFSLEVRSEQDFAYLHGITDYGDSVEDEWLIVYLLRELTLSKHHLWVRVFDSDGEFLFVEAANVLPKWLNPEMDRNRAWIHQGKLYIIPLDDRQSDAQRTILSLQGALDYIKSQRDHLVQSDLVESEAFYRLEKYPGRIASSLHRSQVTLPRKLAHVLHERPKAIAPAVEAFYLRDALSLKPILSSSAELHFPPSDLVTVGVVFTRVLFAQLRSQRFEPPSRWANLIHTNPESRARSRLEMGMKISCGFEMMVNRLDKTDSRVAREVGIILDDLREDGYSTLPSENDIKAWKDADCEDDEAWMNINYEDFERELEGQGRRGSGKGKEQGFGDVNTQADLRKLVSRFEAFLNDESAGLEGAEMDELDIDNDDDDEMEEDSEDEDKAVSFDEEAFASMMREMMGLPADGSEGAKIASTAEGSPLENARAKVPPSSASQAKATNLSAANQDHEGIRQLAQQFEAELNEHGALKLDPTPKKLAALKGKGKSKETEPVQTEAHSQEEHEAGEDTDEDGEVDIDYNLAKNLLESFKSQAGLAGPTGNILGMMGMSLPRDEDEGGDSGGAGKQ